MPARKPEPERFWPKVRKTATCWVWTANTTQGYGRFMSWRAGRWQNTYAHIWAWEDANGPVPEDMEIDHLCSNKRCVRPSHLKLATPSENKQRWAAEERTHCLNHHPLPQSRPAGYQCPTCKEWQRAVDNLRHQGAD